MQTEQIPLDETGCFSTFFLDYISQKSELAPFYYLPPDLKSFEKVIANRNFQDTTREVLTHVLNKQYAGVNQSPLVQANLKSLQDAQTFTVTTGHQLNIFTGPLYFIYKIVTVINTCKRLKAAYPTHNFVPVYWMASEDHDFDEINHFFYQSQKLQWETDQTGAVGRFNPNGLHKIVDQLPEQAHFFKEAYSLDSLADAVRYYVNHLFGEEGLIVIDGDDPELKKEFIPIIEADLFDHMPDQIVPKDSENLEHLGYKPQVHCRPINFFYLVDGLRERIEQQGETFNVLHTDLSFTREELKSLIQAHPERFSPNVILRPLYQETILPNLAYVGGPSEAVYWLQLKSMFDHFQTPFPLLMPRNFATIIPELSAKKWEKTGLSHKDLFLAPHEAFSKWVGNHSNQNLTFKDELEKLSVLYKTAKQKAHEVDPTLDQHLEALHALASKRMHKAEKKLLRAEKRKHTEKEQQIYQVMEQLFPNGSLQERRDSFLNFYTEDAQFIRTLLDTFDPFDYQMYLLFK